MRYAVVCRLQVGDCVVFLEASNSCQREWREGGGKGGEVSTHNVEPGASLHLRVWTSAATRGAESFDRVVGAVHRNAHMYTHAHTSETLTGRRRSASDRS